MQFLDLDNAFYSIFLKYFRRKHLLKMITLLSVCMIFLNAVSCTTAHKDETFKELPNILFIMTDDHAYQALSAYSDELIQTPNIDRIANEGMLFQNASVTNSICGPSRAVILTGTHCHINGKIDNHSVFDTTQIIFPQIFQEEGYQTALFGKLHFGNSPKGFDQFRILPGQGYYYNPDFITKYEGNITVEGYVTDIITDMTIDWLDKERDPNKPFFLAYLHKAPHRAWLPAERHYNEFTKRTFREPETLYDDYEGRGTAAKTAEMNILKHMTLGLDNKINPAVLEELNIEEERIYRYNQTVGRQNEEQRAAWDKVYDPIVESFRKAYHGMTDKELMQWKYQRYMQDYLGCIAAVDEGVGEVLDYLDKHDLSENTIVVYTSDQGFFLGEHGWFDKRFIYQESFKTPLLIRWPGVIEPGTQNTQMVQNLDFAPTFLAAAGIEIPEYMQGENLIPLFRGETENFREAVYYHYYEYPGPHMVKRHYGMATEEFKIAHFYYDVDEWELYDLKKDPMEMNNVYDDPAYTSTVKKLKQDLKELRKKYKDSEELDRKFIDQFENSRK
jgi:arylsulfatase A-like enzyme